MSFTPQIPKEVINAKIEEHNRILEEKMKAKVSNEQRKNNLITTYGALAIAVMIVGLVINALTSYGLLISMLVAIPVSVCIILLIGLYLSRLTS